MHESNTIPTTSIIMTPLLKAKDNQKKSSHDDSFIQFAESEGSQERRQISETSTRNDVRIHAASCVRKIKVRL